MDNIKVLLVDDDPGFLDSSSMLLSPEFDVETAENAEQAISILEEAEGAFDVAVIDMLMYNDEEAGLKLIKQIGQMPIFAKSAPIVLTAHGSIGNASKCMAAGALSYVEKGTADTQEILRQSIKTVGEFKRAFSFPKIPVLDLLEMLKVQINKIEERNPFEYRHSIRVTNWSLAILERMGIATPQKKMDLEIASGLHNIGKALLPEYISDGVRTPKERELFETYPELGRDLVSNIKITITQETLEGILHHHERWDGSGYPHGLKGDKIPLLAGIIAVACEYDHAFSPRDNRALRNPEDARKAILSLKDEGKLDPEVVDAFVAAHEAGEIAKGETERFADVKFTDAVQQIKARQFDQAEQSCEEAIAEISEEDEYFRAALCVAAGDLFLNADDDSQCGVAVEYYAQAIKLRPAYAEAYYKRGLAYQKQSMWEQADAHYAIATAIVPSYLEAHLARGEVRYSGNFLNEAGISFDRVLSLIGKDADIGTGADASQLKKFKALAYLGKGRIHARKGNKPQALANYESALDLCEDDELKEEIETLKEHV